MARRSAIEVVAWLEIIERRNEAPQETLREALDALERVVSMLVKLIRNRGR
jgi:four helix bundle protein